MKLGRLDEARAEIQGAMSMTENLRERELLAGRLEQMEKGAVGGVVAGNAKYGGSSTAAG